MAEKQYGYKTASGGTQLVRKGVSAKDLERMYQEEPDKKKALEIAKSTGTENAREFMRAFEARNPKIRTFEEYPGSPEGYAEEVRGRYAKGGLVKKQKPKPVMKMAKGGMMCSPRKKMAMGGLAKGCKRSGVK